MPCAEDCDGNDKRLLVGAFVCGNISHVLTIRILDTAP